MGTTPVERAAVAANIDENIKRAITLEAEIAAKVSELTNVETVIERELKTLNTLEYITPDGYQALRFSSISYDWDDERVIEFTPQSLLDTFAPRSAAAAVLRKVIDGKEEYTGVDPAELRKCATQKRTWKLKIGRPALDKKK